MQFSFIKLLEGQFLKQNIDFQLEVMFNIILCRQLLILHLNRPPRWHFRTGPDQETPCYDPVRQSLKLPNWLRPGGRL